jgi:hypothetical protein
MSCHVMSCHVMIIAPLCIHLARQSSSSAERRGRRRAGSRALEARGAAIVQHPAADHRGEDRARMAACMLISLQTQVYIELHLDNIYASC